MKVTVSIIFLMLLTFTSSVFADSAEEIDQQLQLFLQYIDRDIAKATVVLQHLSAEKIQFTQEQSNKFVLYKASYLGFVGLHKERIDIVQSVIGNITDQNLKVKFLNLDQWIMFIDFSSIIRPDLSNYSTLDSWPLLFDDFYNWMLSRNSMVM